MANGIGMETTSGKGIEKWLVVVIILATWIFSAGMTYEVITSFRDESQRRLQAIEENQRNFVSHDEFNRQEQFMSDWLTRVEEKLDRALSRK